MLRELTQRRNLKKIMRKKTTHEKKNVLINTPVSIISRSWYNGVGRPRCTNNHNKIII